MRVDAFKVEWFPANGYTWPTATKRFPVEVELTEIVRFGRLDQYGNAASSIVGEHPEHGIVWFLQASLSKEVARELKRRAPQGGRRSREVSHKGSGIRWAKPGDARPKPAARITVDSLNRELDGIGFHVGKCAQDYGLRYFLFCDVPGFAVDEVLYDTSIASARSAPVKHHKPIGWKTLREARDEMLGLVRVERRWYIRRVATGSTFAAAARWREKHPVLTELLLAGTVWIERIAEHHRVYNGRASDGTVVSFGDVGNDDQAERYLSHNQTPDCW